MADNKPHSPQFSFVLHLISLITLRFLTNNKDIEKSVQSYSKLKE